MTGISLPSILEASLHHFDIVMGEPFASPLELIVDKTPAFHAFVRPLAGKPAIHVSTGTVDTINALWSDAWRDPEILVGQGGRIAADRDRLVHYSLMWLMLHEMMHLRLGHLEFVSPACLTGMAAPETLRSDLLADLPPEEDPLIRPCLELQADHDASDLLLEAYTPDQWDELRCRALSIFAVMLLLERYDQQSGGPGPTHPKAATRLFMLVGHTLQMWIHPTATLVPGETGSMLRAEHIPGDDELEAFMHRVITPLIGDVFALARAGVADAFLRATVGQGPFLADLLTVQTADPLSADDLHTEAAREWLKFLPVNERIMTLMGHRAV